MYHLRIWALGHGPGIELTETEYSSVTASMHRIYLARDFEEKLDILLENILEYERDLLTLALQYSLFPSLDDHRVAIEQQLVNRRVTNLLSSARMYVDQVQHSISQIYSGSSGPDAVRLFSAEYDGHLEYRIAEALRNFSQHRALPLHILSWPSAWEEMDSESRRLRFGVVPEISLVELEAEGNFKSKVLEELRQSGKKKFPLTLILRKYVECLARVHEQIRSAMVGQLGQDHEVVLRTIQRARAEFGDSLVGLVVSKGVDAVHADERHFVNESSWSRRKFLVEKNASFGMLSRRFVSAEHPGDVA